MKLLFVLFLSTSLFAQAIELTSRQSEYIANKVWQNEGAGLDKYLIHWNDGEDFASVGIGHFIWFSKEHKEPFDESFPKLLAFMEQKNIEMPTWLNSASPLPWKSKSEFVLAKKESSEVYQELFDLLKNTTSQQAEFLVLRLNKALPKILNRVNEPLDKKAISSRFTKLITNADGSYNEHGLYVLLDYINFKGEGVIESERYQGQGWGLLQVLENMDKNIDNQFESFAKSAKKMLDRRIKNSPVERGEERWREGWFKRIDSYWKNDIQPL